MQKILLLSLIITILSSCSTSQSIEQDNTNTQTGESIVVELTDEEKQKKEAEEKLEKIDTLRKRLALRGLILKGDLNLQNQEYTSALIKYLQIHKEIPNDDSTTEKLGDVYFNLKNFKQAYSYYSEIKDYDKLNKDRVAISLISSMELNDENIKYINKELETLSLNKEQLFYYSNSLNCTKDFSLCKQHFQDFFDSENKEDTKEKIILEAITKEKQDSKNTKDHFEELYNIKTALENYKNFQVDDLLYKGALVSGAFFENGLYPIAIETSKILLEQKDDYKPLLKLIAKSYYELGNYIEAKLYLIKYNRLVDEDAEASYFLGVVYEKLHEYVLSTIHFKKALKTGYKDTLDINKRILFNYYELGEIGKMLETFKLIIENNEDNVTEDDYSLAIYYYIVNDKISDAKTFAEKSLEKYPDSETLNGYYGWILMEEVNSYPIELKEPLSGFISPSQEKEAANNKESPYIKAEEYINKGLEINPKSPMLNLVRGKLEVNKGDMSKAFIYFKKTISLDNNGDFGKIAKQELENIQINK